MLKARKSKTLFGEEDHSQQVKDLTKLETSTVRKAKVNTKTEIRDLRRKETAVQAIEGFDKETEIFGFTKGQFSLADLAEAVVKKIGKCEMTISTWTAANTDITKIMEFIESGKVYSARWLIDISLQRRTPQLAQRIRDIFGNDAIRIAKNHAKFMILKNEEWQVVIRTSMNLNFNPRFEDFTIQHNPELSDFLEGIMNEIWQKQKRELQHGSPGKAEQYFYNEM